ncbi:MAG: hypothetical protein ABIJ46_00540 [bacterium]
MSKETKKLAVLRRRKLVRGLIEVGLTNGEIASLTGTSLSTVENDYHAGGPGSRPFRGSRVSRESDVFRSVLQRLIGLECRRMRPVGRNEDLDSLQFHLEKWLELDELLMVAGGMLLTMRRLSLPQFDPRQLPRVMLLARIFDLPLGWSATELLPSKDEMRGLWSKFLLAMSRNEISMPWFREHLDWSLAGFLANGWRQQVLPVWDERLLSQMDKLLSVLDSGLERRVIEESYGLMDGQFKTLGQVAALLEKEMSLVACIERGSLVKLCRQAKKMGLFAWSRPFDETFRQVVAAQAADKSAEKDQVAAARQKLDEEQSVG